MRLNKKKRHRSQRELPILLGAMIILSSCGVTILNDSESAAVASVTLAQGTADGSGGSAPAGATDTAVTVTPASGTVWNSFIVNLGSHFLAENICAGKTIFGRLGAAMCPEEVSAGNAFRDTDVTLRQEQEGGTCSDQADVPLPQFKTRSSCEKSDVTNKWVPVKLPDERLVSDATKDFEKMSGANYAGMICVKLIEIRFYANIPTQHSGKLSGRELWHYRLP